MKNLFLLALCLVLILSLTACGRTMDNAVNDAESIGDSIVSGTESIGNSVVSDTESIANQTKDTLKDGENSMNLMAGITASDALAAALKHAGVDEAQTSDVEIDLDRDNGKLIYEVDFNVGNTEFDYDINAESGEVISSSKSKD